MNATKTGRPPKTREKDTGDKLRCALQLLGMSWGKNPDTPNHVLKSDRWALCSLPRSVNTITEDIRQGIPSDRIAKYAKFFNIEPDILTDQAILPYSSQFKGAILNCNDAFDIINLACSFPFGPPFYRQILVFNTEEYVYRLFRLLHGVYSGCFKRSDSDVIHNTTLSIHTLEKNVIRFTRFFSISGIDVTFDGIIYRWQSNLHIIYHSHDMFILGHLMTADPLQHLVIANRNPFYIKLYGVSDSIVPGYGPIHISRAMRKNSPWPRTRPWTWPGTRPWTG